MRTFKRIILISLLIALFAGAVLSDPLIRFSLDLRSKRVDDAQAVYMTRLTASDCLQSEAAGMLQRYVDHQLDRYYQRELSGDEVMEILTSLVNTDLPQKDVERCLRSVAEMESARADFAQADGFFSNGDYASAIPLFRRSLIADDSAFLRLEQAESSYKNQLLETVEAAMKKRNVEGMDRMLTDGLSVLGADDDLSAALTDVRRLQEDQAFDLQC